MTAPLRSHGRLVSVILRGCHNKKRYPDQIIARIIGQEQEKANGVKLYVYNCKICRGVHLTRNRQSNPAMAVDWVFKPTPKEAA